jgi:hypothetical protein
LTTIFTKNKNEKIEDKIFNKKLKLEFKKNNQDQTEIFLVEI